MRLSPSGNGDWHRSIQRRYVAGRRNNVRSSSDISSAYPRDTPPVSMTASIPVYLFVQARVKVLAGARYGRKTFIGRIVGRSITRSQAERTGGSDKGCGERATLVERNEAALADAGLTRG